ncbi:hypothetical protein F4779DRAFT_627639 [Xylariaceae sp. FL0662B]|nr:hypothetical protein F4779DRAFT_627639 [Xylariaceae sp. FL0662B]
MAETQEQPQAQPQPEPAAFAAAEEPTHALPHPSLAKSPSLSQAAQEQEKTQEARATTPQDSEASDLERAHIRSHSSQPQPANAATGGLAVAQEQEQERAQEQGQGHHTLHQGEENESANVTNATPASSTALPATVSTATVAAGQATSPSAAAPVNGAVPEQHQENGTTSPAEAMSNNPPHHPGAPRQPVNYSNATAYATPGMNTAHYGYPNPANQGPDAYRANVNAANNAMALPSMRTFDSVQQQNQQQPQHMTMTMPVNSVPPMPPQQPMQYYGQTQVPMAAGNAYGLPPEALGPRYALPPTGPNNVLSGRHKKEIKRRTKTGCLTCRKRRIKCDEQHPVCKNCQKSKRECLGYDPIFKNQQQHPTNIQPAPNNLSSSSTSAPRNGPATSSAPVSGNAQISTNYATLPSVISNTASATTSFGAGLAPTGTTTGTTTSVAKSGPLEYSTAIDPALDSVLSTSSMSTSHFPAHNPVFPNPVEHKTSDTPHLRGGGPSFVPSYPSVSQSTPSHYQPQTSAYTGFSVRKMKVDELVGLGGAVPPTLNFPLTKEQLDEVRDLYDQVYAPGLEKFFETEWYTRPQGVSALVSNTAVNEMLVGFLQSMSKMDANDVAGMQYSANLEFRVVWDLAALVYTSEYKVNVGEHLPATDDGSEARNRVAVFEALLSGDYLDQNPLMPPPENADSTLHHRTREFKFWYLLAEFLRVRDQSGIDVTRQRNHIIGQIRDVLDGRENRDVLYSLAVIRAFAPKFPPDFESSLPPHLDEGDPKSKLAVARKFIQDESQVTGGTTNVVRRFSELAVRAFIVPGSNITRT